MLKILTYSELENYANHLKRLSEHDRYLRFAGYTKDEQIDQYVSSINLKKDAIIGLYDNNLNLIAAIHIGIVKDVAEFGLSVEEKYRGKGIGSKLFERACIWARSNNIQEIYTICLTQNKWMMKKAKKEKMIIYRQMCDAEAHLTLSKPTYWSKLDEILLEIQESLNHLLKKNVFHFKNQNNFWR